MDPVRNVCSSGDTHSFVTSLPRSERKVHAHSAEIVAHDLHENIATFGTNKKAGMDVRPPWCKKHYRPLSFTRGYGWRITPEGVLALSLGRGRPRCPHPRSRGH